MAQSTEDYLDSLLRQAMGIPDPEPEKKPEENVDLGREDVLAMAEGLTGSNSAILGNAYDHNASFTNEGEIQHTTAPAAAPVTAVPTAAEQPAQSDISDTFATDSFATDVPVTEQLSSEPRVPEYENTIQESTDQPVMDADEPVMIPEGPVVEHDGNLDIIPEPSMMEEISLPEVEIPVEENPSVDMEIPMEEIPSADIDIPSEEIPVAESEQPAIEEPVIGEPVIEEPAIEEPVIEEPVIEEPAIEEPVIEEPAIEEPAIEEPVIEEPAIEEPAIEEPVIEEPAIEEPVIEEPITEEPAVEKPETPGMSIDDLDPNDAAKALDPDMIAALFDSANAAAEETPAEEPVAEEPVAEEPVAEEPVAEEPVAEEPVAEEPVAEEPVTEEPVAEEAAAEEPEAEESVAEEAPAEEAGDEGEADIVDPFTDSDMDSLEALDISLGEPEDAPLMPDQEISDLLSTLGELSGENTEPEEDGGEAPAEESPEEAAEVSGEEPATEDDASADLGIDGIDMFDTDLSAMLDDVTTNLDLGDVGQAAPAEDSDLNELLGSLDDGSGDLSDIGNLLDKDENSELVDPNTETAEALFGSGSEDEIFDIDNVIEEEQPKKKKKKGFSLFKKKKKGEGDVEILGEAEEMLIDPELLDIPEKEMTEKKVGFFGRLLAKLFEEVDEGNDDVSGIEQSAVDIAQEGAAENEAILSELEAEEGGDGKKDKKKKKEKKKKDKKDKKGGKDAEAEDGEEPAEDTKKKKKEKKEKKKKEKLPEIPGKRLPRKKVVAISLFCITIGIVITFLAFLIPYSQDIKKAKKFYTTGEYQKTYEYMRGHKLTSDDQILYDRTITLLRIKRPYDSYQNYMKMGLRMEALNALVQGVQMTDKYAEEAARLGIIDKYSKQSRLIYDELYNSFGVSVDMARSWIELEGTPEYTRALYGALVGSSGVTTLTDGDTSSDDFSFEVEQDNDPVINAEENDL